MWTNEEATYHGEFVDFDRIVSRPAPLQEPHPPVLVGGNGPNVLKRVLAFGDGWFPNRIPPDDQMIARVEELQRLGEEAGRAAIPVTLQIPPRDPEVLRRYEEAGVTRRCTCCDPATRPMWEARSASSTSGPERIQAYR